MPKMMSCITTGNQHRICNKNGRTHESKIYGHNWHSKWWDVKGEIIEQSITPIHMMLTPKTQEMTDPNDRPCCPMHIFQQRNIHNPNVYTDCRFTPSDHPPQRIVGDHQLMNHQSDTVQNDMYLPLNHASTPFQPQNQNSILDQQQKQLDPSDLVVQHLQQQALNQSQLTH